MRQCIGPWRRWLTELKIEVGPEVLIENMSNPNRKEAKMEQKFIDQYTVVKVLPKNCLQLLNTLGIKLKLFQKRGSLTSDSDTQCVQD